MAKLSTYLKMQQEGLLGRAARTFNSENLVANEYLAPAGTKVGDQCLYIEYIYDSRGNILSEDKSIQIWTQSQENVTETEVADVIDSSADEVSAKSQTSYSTDTTNAQYWLGLENDEQLTKSHTDNVSATKKIIHYALPNALVGDSCLERVYRLSSGEIVGEAVLVGTWTQAMQDVVAPPISDLTLSAATTVEDQLVDTLIGNLAVAGDNTGHGTVTFSLTSTTLSGDKIRIDGSKLEVGPNPIGSSDAGTYDMVLRATDSIGAIREETHTLTVTSNNITDIALSASTIPYGSNADTAIGTLSYTGGVGTLTPTITSDGGMTNLRLDGNVLEAGPSWMNTAAGTYTVRITVTDEAPTPQTYYEDFTITVSSTAITDIDDSVGGSDFIVAYGDPADTEIVTLVFTGGFGTVTPTITDAGGMTNIRLDGNVLEVGPSWMNTTTVPSGTTYTIEITATDIRSQTRVESFDVTVTSTAITDIALSASEIVDNAIEGIDIGNLTCTGGVGDVAYSITAAGGLDNVKVTDTGSSTAVFEVDTGGIVDSVGSYSVTFLATDTVGQTYSKTFSISVIAAYGNLKFLNFNTGDALGGYTSEQIKMGIQSDFDDDDDFWFRRLDDDYTISWWMRMPESDENYTAGNWKDDVQVFGSTTGTFTNGIAAFFRSADFVFVITDDGSNLGWFKVSNIKSWQDNTWAHYAIVYDSSAKVAAGEGSATGITIYRNNVSQTISVTDYGTWLDSNHGTNNTTGHFTFGMPDYESQNHTNKIFGVNDIAVWKSALSASNITSIYNSGIPATVLGIDDDNLKRYYQFENKGNHITMNSDPDNNRIEIAGLQESSISSAKQIICTDKDFTISFWYKNTSNTGTPPQKNCLFGFGGSASDANSGRFLVYFHGSNGNPHIDFAKHPTDDGYAYTYGTPQGTSIWNGEWAHIALVWKGDGFTNGDSWNFNETDDTSMGPRLYLNGTLQTNFTSSAQDWYIDNSEVTGKVTVGDDVGSDHSGWASWAGQAFDNIEVFNEYKTSAQIDAIILKGSSNETDSSCVVSLNFEAGSDLGAKDTDDTFVNASTHEDSDEYTGNIISSSSGYITGVEGGAAVNGFDAAEKYRARIGSDATILDHYSNTKYFNIPVYQKHQRIKIPGIADDGTSGVTPVIQNTRDWTVSCWVNSAVPNGDIFALGKLIGLQIGHWSSKIHIQAIDGGTDYSTFGAFPADQWVHLVVVFKGVASDEDTWTFDADATSESTTGISLYINGARVSRVDGSSTTSDNTFGGLEFNWLQRYPNPYQPFTGKYDNLAIFNVKKTAAQILAMYNEGHGTNLENDSNCVSLLRADDMATAALSSNDTITNSGGASSADDYIAKWDDGDENGTLTVTEY